MDTSRTPTSDPYNDDLGASLPPPKSPRISAFRDDIGILDEPETAGVIGWAPRTLQARRIEGGDIPPFRRIGRRIVYLKADVETWLKRQPTHRHYLDEVKHRQSAARTASKRKECVA